MANSQTRSENGTSTVWQIVGRLIAAAVVLAITAFFTPGFTINNIWALAIAAVVLTVMDYLIVKNSREMIYKIGNFTKSITCC